MLILGLIWTLIRHYQLATHRHHPDTEPDEDKKEEKEKKEEGVHFESLVLRWVQVTLPQCSITNFTTDWNDGRNLSALINYCKPGLIPENATLDPTERISIAMDLAKEHFGIPKIMRPEDLASEKPDKKSVTLYLSHFCCPDPSGQDSIGQKVLLEWIQQQIPDQTVSNFTTDWTDGKSLGALTNAVSGGRFPDYKEMGPTDTVDNCCQSMDAAERLLDVQKTIAGVKKMAPHEVFAKPRMNQLQRMIYLTPFRYAPRVSEQAAVSVQQNELETGLNMDWGRDSPSCLVFHPSKLRVNTTCEATVDASMVLGRSGDIAVTAINGPSVVEQCQVAEQESESGKYDITFVPHEIGSYVVTIEFENFLIPKTQFTLAVNDPSKVVVTPEDLGQGQYRIGQPITFTISTKLAGEGKTAVTVKGPMGSKHLTLQDEGEGTYLASFTPSEAGPHEIKISFDGDKVPCSPIHLTVDTGVFVDRVIVTEPVPGRLGKYVIEHPYDYKVNAAEAGEASLSATGHGARSGAKPDIAVTDEGNGQYTVCVTASEPDDYHVGILWGGEHVPGSPFQISIEDKPRPDQVVCSGPHYVVGSTQPVTLDVDAEKGGAGELSAICHGNKQGSVPVEIKEEAPKKYTLAFSPPAIDAYSLSVLWSEEVVKNSPFKIDLLVPPDASKCIVTGPEIPPEMDAPVTLQVDASDAGHGKLSASAIGEVVGTIPVGIEEVKPSVFVVSLSSSTPDKYNLLVNWGEQPVPGSPFFLNLLPPNAKAVTIARPPDSTIVAGQPITICFDVSKAGRGILTCTCSGTDVGEVQERSVTRSPDGKFLYDVQFVPPDIDLYTLNVFWSGKHVKQSPFTINLAPPDITKVKVIGPTYSLGGPVELMLQTHGAGKGRVTASCFNSSGEKIPVSVDETSHECYQVSFRPPKPDVYKFSAQFGGEDVQGAPFFINTIPPDASKVIVKEPEVCEISKALSYQCDVSLAGSGKLKATCQGESCGPVPITVEERGSTSYDLLFTPLQPDIYIITVEWAGQEVPGSPFKINLLPPDPKMVEVGVFHYPQRVGTAEEAWVDLDCSKTGPAKPKGECEGKDGRVVPVDIVEKPDSYQTYRVKFLPKEADTYHLHVFYGPGEVPGSPFEATIEPVEAPAEEVKIQEIFTKQEVIDTPEVVIHLPQYEERKEPPKTSEEELALWVGELLKITVKTKQKGDFTATAVGAKTGAVDIKTEQEQDEDGNFVITFNPDKPDRYTIEATLNNEPIPKSPLIANYTLRTDASKCYIIDFEHTTDVLEMNKEVRFGVNVADAGDGSLSVTADGPSSGKKASNQLVVTQTPDNPMIYNVSYLPTACGQHRIHIQWAKEAIPMSPLVLQVGEKVDIPTYSIHGPIRFVINANCQAHELTSHAIHQESGIECKVDISEAKPGTFSLSFMPTDPGVYCIHVFLRAKEIQGSPYKICYSPQQLSPQACVVHGLQDKDYVPLELIEFSVDATKAGNGDLRITLLCPSADDRSEISIIDNKDSTYGAKFIPKKPGTYRLKITFADEPITDDPIPVRVVAKGSPVKEPKRALRTMMKGDGIINIVEVTRAVSIRILEMVPEAFQCIGEKTGEAAVAMLKEASGCRLVRFVPTIKDDYKLTVRCNRTDYHFLIRAVERGSLSPRYVIPKGEKGLLEAKTPINLVVKCGDDDVSVTADGPHGPCEATITDQLEGSIGIGLTPNLPGDYFVHVKKHGSEVGDSPYKLSIRKKDIHIHLQVHETYFIFETGCYAHFDILTTEASPGNLNISMKGPGKAEIKVFDKKDGTYSCDFIPSVPGKYTINVMWNNEHIPGSPFTLNFRPKNSQAIIGLSLENETFYIDSPYRFKLDCSELGEGHLRIKCKPASAATMSATPIRDTNFYQCEINPLEVGNHLIKVLYQAENMKAKQILGSPFNVVFRLRGDASKCKVIDSPVSQAHELGSCVTFSVSAKEAGRGILTAFAESSSTGTKLSIPVAVAEVKEHEYSIDFCPVEGNDYLLSILYDEQHIPDSPFKITFSDPKQTHTEVVTEALMLNGSLQSPTTTLPSAENVKAYGSGLRDGYVGQEGNFIINTGKGGSGFLDVKVKGPKGAYKVKMRYQPDNERIIFARYDPSIAGTYKIEITWSGVHIPDSPFEVNFANQK